MAVSFDRHVVGAAANATRSKTDNAGRSYKSERLSGVSITVTAVSGVADVHQTATPTIGSVISSSYTHYDAVGLTDYSIGVDGQRTDYTYNAKGEQESVLAPAEYDAETHTTRHGTTTYTRRCTGKTVKVTARGHDTKTSTIQSAGSRIETTTFRDGSYVNTTDDAIGQKCRLMHEATIYANSCLASDMGR